MELEELGDTQKETSVYNLDQRRDDETPLRTAVFV